MSASTIAVSRRRRQWLQLSSHGHRFLLGKRQPSVLEGGAGTRTQGSAIQQSFAAVRPPGAQVTTNAGDEFSRQTAGAARRGLRGVRVAGDSVLPRPQISGAADI